MRNFWTLVGAAYVTAVIFGSIAGADSSLYPDSIASRSLPLSGGVVTGDVALTDDSELRWGTDLDYWSVYNSSSTEFEFWSSNCNGGGADCSILIVDDGTDDLVVASGGVSLSAAYAATCTGDASIVDNNGLQGAPITTDTAPQGMLMRPQPAFPGGTQTAANAVVAGGIDEIKATIATAANCALNYLDVTVFNSNGTATTTRCTEGTGWTRTNGDNNATAASLEACVEAITGVSSAPSSATVLLTPDFGVGMLFVATDDATCITVANGTMGRVLMPAVAVCPATQLGVTTGCIASYSGGLRVVDSAGAANKTISAFSIQGEDNSTATIWVSGNGGGMAVGSNGQFSFSSGTSGGTGSDTGIKRIGAAIIGPTNASSGNGDWYVPTSLLTTGTMTATNVALSRRALHRYDWTNAMVVALGATTAGDITVATLPAKTKVVNAYVVITGQAASVTTLTVAVGRTSAAYIDYIVASDAKAAVSTVYGDSLAERGTNLTGYDLPSWTGTTAINAHFVSSGGNLSAVTASTGSVYLETITLP